ncbi:uncharacterized protein LOC124909575 [Impatiens glandulifera]|uniref:uncharacterized protein LOC124909575 n=1 Tax=Impatiens glandulifera TaxID=253017 RepID=UPI001FB117CF|nr:uncharacterized protein LOC124909575 [Impatiens glandulifera]
MEIEEEVINLTKAQDVNTALERYTMVEPRARLQKLIEHIQRLQEKYTPGTPNSQLQLLVLELLAVKERALTEELARLEAMPEHQDPINSPPPEDVGGQNLTDEELSSPPPDQTINMTEVRTETPLTDHRASAQAGDSEPAITEERVKTLIEEFINDAVQPWKKKIKETAVKAVEIAETTKDDLNKAVDRITLVETNTDRLYNGQLDQTKALEYLTPKLVDDLTSVSQRVDEDLARSSAQAGSTLDRLINLEEKNTTLEEKNAKLEADLKAVTEQVAELIEAKLASDKAIEEANAPAAQKLQDALDEQTRIQKEAVAADANIAGHMQNLAVNAPAIAKTIAAQQAKDALRLRAQ